MEAHTRSLKIAKDVDVTHLAEVTLGYVGADIASLCREAAFVALKRTFGHSLTVQETLEGNKCENK